MRLGLVLGVLVLAGCMETAPDAGEAQTGAELPQPDGPFLRREVEGEPFCLETVDTRTGEVVEVECVTPVF